MRDQHDEHDDDRPLWRSDDQPQPESRAQPAAVPVGEHAKPSEENPRDFLCDDDESLCDTEGHDLKE